MNSMTRKPALRPGGLAFALLIPVLPTSSPAYYIYGDPAPCSTCEVNRPPPGTSGFSLTEGNVHEQLPIANVMSALGSTLGLSLHYNSYNADGTRANVNTVLGYGWTHSYNIFLFSQRGHMFRFDGTGRVTKYTLGPGGTFTAPSGYFETLVRHADGSFTLRQKDGTAFKFAAVPATPFLVGGPVYPLISITNRNGDVTSLTYVGGLLAKVTNTYGQSLVFSYNAQKRLSSATDPGGRVTSFAYDSSGRTLNKVTPPLNQATQYTYNAQYQITGRVGPDGRVHTYHYASGKPRAKADGLGAYLLRLANPGNWTVNEALSAPKLERTYVPGTTTLTDGRGNSWKYDFDANGYIVRRLAPDGAIALYTYDPATRMMATETNENGHTTRYHYDARGNVISITNALGQITTYTYEPAFNMVTSKTDAKGRVTRYEYDARGNRIKEIDAAGQTQTWTRDSHGNILTHTDKRGNTTRYAYDATGNLAEITAPPPLGYVTRMTYDAVGNVTSRIDPNLHLTVYNYDARYRLTTKTDATGKSDRYEYDGAGNRTKETDRNGNATQSHFDHRGRLFRTIDALGQTTTTTYDGNNNRTSATDQRGNTTSFVFDVRDRLVRITDAELNVVQTFYDPASNVVTEIDGNGNPTSYQYDALNRRTRITDAEGFVTRFEYDTGGSSSCGTCGVTPGMALITKQTDGNGKVTYFKYDKLDRLIDVVRKEGDTADAIDASDALTSYAYDPNGNRLIDTEPNGNALSYEYDVLNRRVRETNAAGDTTRFTYDGVHQVVTTIRPNGNVVTFTYDSLDRLQQVSDSLGLIVRYTLDNVGNRLTQTDANGHTTRHVYDALHRRTTTIDPSGEATSFQYDPVGNIIKVTDREGRSTTHIYDRINRRTSSSDPLPATTRYRFDAVGNVVEITDAKGDATRYEYDKLHRPRKEIHPDPSPNTLTFTYDAVSLVGRTDQNGLTTTYIYNDLYFLVRRSYPISPADNLTYDLSGRMLAAERGGWLVTFAYDGANRVVQTSQNGRNIAYVHDIPGRTRTVVYPGGRRIVRQFDLRGRLSSAGDVGSLPPVVQYTYDLGNRVGTRTYRNGVVASHTYNANDWVLSLDHRLGAVRIAGFDHEYDREGNKKFEGKRHETARSEAYQYDSADRLIDYKVGSLVGTTVPVPATQTAYTLDPVGNWISKTSDGVIQNRVHNQVNELVQIDATPLSYDHNGNLQQDALFTYAYDEENRLVRATRLADGMVVGEYRYDALGRRVQKVARPAGAPVTTRYFHDGWQVIAEEDAMGATLATYVYGNHLDEVASMDRSGQSYYYHQNTLWSVFALTNSAGTIVETCRYDVYGRNLTFTGPGADGMWYTGDEPAAAASGLGNPYAYSGQRLDAETGLMYFKLRCYSPNLGRFSTRDPLGGIDLYQYVGGGPTKWIDPLGLENGNPVEIDPKEWWKKYAAEHPGVEDEKGRKTPLGIRIWNTAYDGCIGLTCVGLGVSQSGLKYDNCYREYAQAEKRRKEMEDNNECDKYKDCYGEKSHARIFAIRFWSGLLKEVRGEAGYEEEKKKRYPVQDDGKIDISRWPGSGMPYGEKGARYYNFDYAIRDRDKDRWIGANRAFGEPGAKVKEWTEAQFSGYEYVGFDMKVYCVQCEDWQFTGGPNQPGQPPKPPEYCRKPKPSE